MIDKELFKAKIGEVAVLLSGKFLTKDYEQAIYNSIRDRYDDSDLSKACADMLDEVERFSFPSLMKRLNAYRSARIAQEIKDRQDREQDEVKAFFKSIGHESCRGGNCFACDVKYCDTVAHESITALKRILSREAKASDENKRLAAMFKGIGFEAEMPELQPF